MLNSRGRSTFSSLSSTMNSSESCSSLPDSSDGVGTRAPSGNDSGMMSSGSSESSRGEDKAASDGLSDRFAFAPAVKYSDRMMMHGAKEAHVSIDPDYARTSIS